MSRRLSIVNYAINGSSLGHLTRLVAINRWMRRYLRFCGVPADVYFLSTSEADTLLFNEGFASFKLPSKTAAAEAGLDRRNYVALLKQWVWQTLGSLRPDLLVVDTFPYGAFHELVAALDLCARRAFIYRPVQESTATAANFQAMLAMYDRLIVPEQPGVFAAPVPPSVHSRVRYTGPIAVRERAELVRRAQAREMFGIPDDRYAVLVTGGGGGDASAENHLMRAIETLAPEPDLHLVVAAGPLYRGQRRYRANVTWTTSVGVAESMLAFDVAVAAAGYNTFYELVQAQVPSVLVPQPKSDDEQRVRADRAVREGVAVVVATPDIQTHLTAAVRQMLEAGRRGAMGASASRLLPKNCARDAAIEVLRLVVDENKLFDAEEALDEPLLLASARSGVSLNQLGDLVHALARDAVPNQQWICELSEASGAVASRAESLVAAAVDFRALHDTLRSTFRRLDWSNLDDRLDWLETIIAWSRDHTWLRVREALSRIERAGPMTGSVIDIKSEVERALGGGE